MFSLGTGTRSRSEQPQIRLVSSTAFYAVLPGPSPTGYHGGLYILNPEYSNEKVSKAAAMASSVLGDTPCPYIITCEETPGT
jgi:hypothetical protein